MVFDDGAQDFFAFDHSMIDQNQSALNTSAIGAQSNLNNLGSKGSKLQSVVTQLDAREFEKQMLVYEHSVKKRSQDTYSLIAQSLESKTGQSLPLNELSRKAR